MYHPTFDRVQTAQFAQVFGADGDPNAEIAMYKIMWREIYFLKQANVTEVVMTYPDQADSEWRFWRAAEYAHDQGLKVYLPYCTNGTAMNGYEDDFDGRHHPKRNKLDVIEGYVLCDEPIHNGTSSAVLARNAKYIKDNLHKPVIVTFAGVSVDHIESYITEVSLNNRLVDHIDRINVDHYINQFHLLNEVYQTVIDVANDYNKEVMLTIGNTNTGSLNQISSQYYYAKAAIGANASNNFHLGIWNMTGQDDRNQETDITNSCDNHRNLLERYGDGDGYHTLLRHHSFVIAGRRYCSGHNANGLHPTEFSFDSIKVRYPSVWNFIKNL